MQRFLWQGDVHGQGATSDGAVQVTFFHVDLGCHVTGIVADWVEFVSALKRVT